jgi:hypothetical protein
LESSLRRSYWDVHRRQVVKDQVVGCCHPPPPSATVASDDEDTDDEVSNRLPVHCKDSFRRAGKTSHRSRSSLTKEDLLIGVKSAEKLLGLKTIQRPYHPLLEYPRQFYVDKRNGQRSEVSLELQVNLIVAYMLHLLARRGLGAKGVFKGAFEHLTSRGYLSRVNVSSQLNLCLGGLIRNIFFCVLNG